MSAPYLNKFLNNVQYRLFAGMSIVFFIILVSSLNIDSFSGNLYEFTNNVLSALKRVASFVIGMTIAPLCRDNKRINPLFVSSFFLILYVGIWVIRIITGIFIFCNWCLPPILLIVFCKLLDDLPVNTKPYAILSWLGVVSLESYITNGGTQGIARFFASSYSNYPIFYGGYLEYFIVIVLGLSFAYVLNKLSVMIVKRLDF